MRGGDTHCNSTLLSQIIINNNEIESKNVSEEDKQKEILYEPHYCSEDEFKSLNNTFSWVSEIQRKCVIPSHPVND